MLPDQAAPESFSTVETGHSGHFQWGFAKMAAEWPDSPERTLTKHELLIIN